MRGIYALVISVGRDIEPTVGSLGSVSIAKGRYVYVGSAQNGLESRIARHRRREKRKFWHIDYLLDTPGVTIERVFWKHGSKDQECRTASRVRGTAVKGFGCSDCGCGSHLFRIRNTEFFGGWKEWK